MTTQVEYFLEELLAKAKTGEIDAVFVVASRANVKSGGVAYVGAAGLWSKVNYKLRDALRLTWQNGMRDFGWSHFNSDVVKPFKIGRS